MRTKKLIAITLALIVTLAAFSGCSSGSSSAGQPQSASGAAPGSQTATPESDNGQKNTAPSEAPIKLGLLEDQSGDFAYQGVYKKHAAELAVKEINDAGGLLGRPLELVAPDTQSDNQKYQELARKLILEDKVDVVMGAATSAAREAIRPIMEENKMLYFYNNQYEGGVASHYTFCTGVIPDHQIMALIKYMVDNVGPNCYIISADYNFGQISAMWVEKALGEYGGKLVGSEFLPLSVSQFSSSIEKIQNAKPDFLFVLLTGVTQSSFYGQWATAGLGIPMASTINIAQGYEHKRFDPPALANMYVAAPFIEELDSPAANAFKDNFHAMFPDEPYMGMETENVYVGIKLWAKAVEQAGTTEAEAVIQALESGISYDGPVGTVTIDPKTHHTIRDIWVFYCTDQHEIVFMEKYDQVQPDWLSTEQGIDLTREAPNKQYTPLD